MENAFQIKEKVKREREILDISLPVSSSHGLTSNVTIDLAITLGSKKRKIFKSFSHQVSLIDVQQMMVI